MDSYGYIETMGLVAAIDAADAALKAANVQLKNCYVVTGGIVTVELVGDVGAVKAAVSAGAESAKRTGNLLSTNVIARMSTETTKILYGNTLTKEEVSETLATKPAAKEAVKPVEKAVEVKAIVQKNEPAKMLPDKGVTATNYDNIKIAELREKAKKLGFTNSEIKAMDRKKLIEVLIKGKK